MDITYQAISLMLRRFGRTFGADVLAQVRSEGIPRDVESAWALAQKPDDRTRNEFEKWAVLTYTNNRSMINEKQGADAGIDGTAFFQTGKTDNAKVIFQVESGGAERTDVAALRGDMQRVRAALGVLITFEEPTAQMRREAEATGQYWHELMGRCVTAAAS
jgi:site-specific DNA-methyltransferase (adenine-specific)